MDEIKQHVAEIEIPRKPDFAGEITSSHPIAHDEMQIIMDDEKPEVSFEVADVEEEAIIIEQPKPSEPVAETVPVIEAEINNTAADEANEALAEMHKAAEKAREEAIPVNKPRNSDNYQVPKNGGGSFFDQI